MIDTIAVLHAVVEGAIIHRVGASERRVCAPVAYGQRRQLGGRQAAGRVREFRMTLYRAPACVAMRWAPESAF